MTRQGIFFVDVGDVPRPTIKFFDFRNGEATRITTFGKTPEPARPELSVSPDGQWLLYGQVETDTADIMLVENFR